jgi:hypothetical protein
MGQIDPQQPFMCMMTIRYTDPRWTLAPAIWAVPLVRVPAHHGAHRLSIMSLVGETRTVFVRAPHFSSKMRVVRRTLSNCRTRGKSPSCKGSSTGATPVPPYVLTRDNACLSRLRNDSPDDPDSRSNEVVPAPAEDQSPPLSVALRANDCTLGTPDSVPGKVAALVEASIAKSTRRAYRTDLTHFAAWGSQMPAEPALVAVYIGAHSETLSVAMLVRRMTMISKAHEARGCPTPACRKSSAPP